MKSYPEVFQPQIVLDQPFKSKRYSENHQIKRDSGGGEIKMHDDNNTIKIMDNNTETQKPLSILNYVSLNQKEHNEFEKIAF